MASGTNSLDVTTFGFAPGQLVQEFGWDEDTDNELRAALEELSGSELLDEDYDSVVDGVIVWYRDGDEDLTDFLVDVQTLLREGGLIWVLTPKAGRAGHVSQGDIVEAAATAGLHATTTFPACPQWSGTKLAARGRSRLQ
ncbi:DUF3052 domain-containing protein [Rarobacter incanus]|uniref:DUF3052 family protein n=1 Tax=Rarobacter incanus TaxID=153494 RepID=A0A542SMQ5_9MICO|nr:DUF3052 domain-containing protein [Rarobacter incanus]TQK75910.1 DUF3052 family protein [Rarobacter incanus]